MADDKIKDAPGNDPEEELEGLEVYETGRSKEKTNKVEKLRRELAQEEANLKEKRTKLRELEESIKDQKRRTRKKIEVGGEVLKRAGWAGAERWPELKKIKNIGELVDDYEDSIIERWKSEHPVEISEQDQVCLDGGKRIWDMTDRLSLDYPTVIDSIIKTAEENARRWEDMKQ